LSHLTYAILANKQHFINKMGVNGYKSGVKQHSKISEKACHFTIYPQKVALKIIKEFSPQKISA
jgi:hypothetical protein